MAKTQMVESPRLAPRKCALSGRSSGGPFIDTGTDIPRYGRVYIQERALARFLRDNGYLSKKEADRLRERVSSLQEEVEELHSVKEKFDAMAEAVSEYLPTPELPIREVPVTVTRDPTDREIEDWIKKYGASHPAVQNAQLPEPGSPEEWQKLYGDKNIGKPRVVKKPTPAETTEETSTSTEESESTIFVLHDQEVDLNEVLNQNVTEVLEYVQGQPQEFIEAVLALEESGKGPKGDPRTTLVDGLTELLDEEDETEDSEEDDTEDSEEGSNLEIEEDEDE